MAPDRPTQAVTQSALDTMAGVIVQATAFANAVTYRMSTFYIPPIFGVFAMRWLSARSYVG